MTAGNIISRTYNVYGERDFLIRMEGNCPVWNGDKKQAMRMTNDAAHETQELISTYRDWMCPNGIEGVEIVTA
ncbi:MAG: hypothetical protein CL535_16435 [Ahrensia sp.]|nr:hypothetical protein [Ahrensia sp.]MBV48161.1 hypothetical protein [Roseobacter sp.]MBV48262.1 hypothetical protein [Roseobacter sp.]|tara:strand:- start:134370 stop:134588 length:219 start_codon:yes stop_codon:yes gene_type:complete